MISRSEPRTPTAGLLSSHSTWQAKRSASETSSASWRAISLPLAAESARLSDRVSPSLASLVRMWRSEEHTSDLQSLIRNSYAVFCLKKKNTTQLQFFEHHTSPHSTDHCI